MSEPMTKQEWMAYIEKTWDAAQKEEWAEKQEPVQIMGFNCVCGRRMEVSAKQGVVPAPPQRQWTGLTDEEKQQFVVAYYPSSWDRKTAVALMNNYETYLKEKNT